MVLENFLIDVDILWDRVGKGLYTNPEARAGRKMRVQVINDGIVEDLTGYALNLGWTSVKDATKFGLDAFEVVDITEGLFEIPYTSGMLSNYGYLTGTLQIVPPAGNLIESNNFDITVRKSGIDASAIQSSTSFTALAEALIKVNNLESTYAPDLNAVKQQLEQTNIIADTASQKADAMASGSPKGVYATLALLQSAYPTGTTGAYLVSADGNWYYYNGTAWVSGGIYQSTGIADSSVTEAKTSFFKPTLNMFNKDTVTVDRQIGTGGANETNVGFDASDYIPVVAEAFYTKNIIGRIAWYDSAKVFISLLIAPLPGTPVQAPVNAAFARISIAKNSAPNDKAMAMFVSGSDLPTEYVPFKQIERKNVVKETGLLEPEQTTFIERTIGKNKLNKANAIPNTVISSTNATYTTNELFDTFDFTEIEPLTTYVKNFASHVAFFTSDGVFISFIARTVSLEGVPFTSPLGAKLARFSFARDATHTIDTAQLELGTVVTPYANYTETNTLINGSVSSPNIDVLEGRVTVAESDIVALQGSLGQSTKQSLKMSLLPIDGNGERLYNATSYIQDNVTTFGDTQYAVYWSFDSKPIIAKRNIYRDDWETFDLSTVVGNPLDVLSYDGHNTLTVAVDSTGFIHVSGNHHSSPLHYIRSVNPADITVWEAPGMSGSSETMVTYPKFFKRKDGTLLFAYRSLGTGDGNYHMNIYNAATKTWTKLIPWLIDGTTYDEDAYVNHIAVDTAGVIHLSGCFRSLGLNGTSSNDIWYAKSADGGLTWKKTTGATIALPMTHATLEIALDTAPIGSGLLNQFGMEVDADGNPHIAYFKYDANGYTNLYHIYHNGTTWIDTQVTFFKRTQSTDVGAWPGEIARPAIFTTANRVFIIYRVNYDGKNGTLRILEVTPSLPAPIDFPIFNMDLYNYEATFDTQALYERNELTMLMIPSKSDANMQNDSFSNQMTGVLTIDLSQIDKFVNKEVQLPQLSTVATMVDGQTVSITQAAGDVALPYGLIPLSDYRDDTLFFRLTIRASMGTNTNLTVGVETKGDLTTSTYATRLLNTSTATWQTAWVKVRDPYNSATGTGGYIKPTAVMSLLNGATEGTATITGIRLEVAKLEY